MDEKSLEMLEFPRIRETIAGLTSFSASRDLANEITPATDHERICLELGRAAEARQLLGLDPSFSIGGVTDVRDAVKVAALESVLDPEVLLQVQQTLASVRQLRANLGGLCEDFPLLWDIARGMVSLPEVERHITDCLDPSGNVLDTASPNLSAIRQQIREMRRQLLQRLDAIIKSPKGQQVLQEDVVTEREGRYVILVKVECRHEVKGIVHDISNSGATVFVEPTATVGLGNALRELEIEERREVARILGALSAEVGGWSAEISESISLAADLDLVLAKGRYARKIRAAEPVMISPEEKGQESRSLTLAEARHPMLGEKAVPFSVEIGRDFSTLVITGPNTGGKTVTLKTIGLLCLMAQSGLPIPAAPESRLPIFDGIFADIGDEQSIEQTVSTFGWHMNNVVRIIRGATPRSLVLLDELGTSTDPTEGSALARAILRYFLTRDTLTVATTHYSDLKAFAQVTPGLENASLDFDPVTLAPTYHLAVGLPGGSNAMATAARLGVPAEIIDDARSMLPGGSREMEELLAGLMVEKQKVETLRRDLSREKEEMARRQGEIEEERTRLKTEERRMLEEARDEIVRQTAELNREIRQAAADLRRERSAARLEQARKAMATVRERLGGEAWQARAKGQTGGEGDGARISTGDTVWVPEAGLKATVLSVSEENGEVEVQAGRTKMRLSLDSVEKAAGAPDGVAAEAPAGRQSVRRRVPMELDLRGKRADEVEWALDAYLNDAVTSNIAEARIIHGMATGTVRQIVRDVLASHPLVKSFRSGERSEGGDGVTIVRL